MNTLRGKDVLLTLSSVIIKHLCPKTLCVLDSVDFHFLSFSFPLFIALRETYVEQLQGENSNDRNDRAIRVAAKWYNEHLKDMSAENQLQVIFITNDRKNKEKAIEEGIPAFTCKSPCIQTVSSCLQMHAKIIIRPRSDVHLTIWYFHGRI